MPKRGRRQSQEERTRELLKHCGGVPVTLNLKYRETVANFFRRLEESDELSRRYPAQLTNKPEET